jgi:hypothetical protein
MTQLEFLKRIGAVTVPEGIIRRAEENSNKSREIKKDDAPVKPAK